MTNYNNNQYGGGEAASYYASAQQGQQQYNNNGQQQQDGPTGERGVLGALGGAVAGGVGGHAIGGKTGHSKTSTIIGAIAGAVAGHKLQDGVSDWKDKRDEEKEKKKQEEEEAKRREEDEKRRREDDEKRRREDEERRREEQNRPQHHQQQNHQSSSRGGNYAGNFSSSSRDIRVDAHGEYLLHASCARMDGSYQASSISLNKILENDRGSFRWASGRASSNNNHGGGDRPRQVSVNQGDTLRDIGSRIGVPWEEIARHNNLQNPDRIFPGQLLQIPQAGSGGGGGGSGGNFGASARNIRLEDGNRLVAELQRDGQWVTSSINLDERIGNENGTLTYKN